MYIFLHVYIQKIHLQYIKYIVYKQIIAYIIFKEIMRNDLKEIKKHIKNILNQVKWLIKTAACYLTIHWSNCRHSYNLTLRRMLLSRDTIYDIRSSTFIRYFVYEWIVRIYRKQKLRCQIQYRFFLFRVTLCFILVLIQFK